MGDRKAFAGSVTPLPQQLGLIKQGLMVNAMEAQHRTDKMTILFSLSIASDLNKELQARVARGEVVGTDELNKKYVVNAKDVTALVRWLKGQGFEIVKQLPDGTGVYARGSVDQIEQSLQVKMVRVTKDGLTHTAASNAPSLPAEVAGNVHAIVGLQPFRQAHKHSIRRMPKKGNRAALRGAARAAVAPTTNIANAPPCRCFCGEWSIS